MHRIGEPGGHWTVNRMRLTKSAPFFIPSTVDGMKKGADLSFYRVTGHIMRLTHV